MSPEYEKALRDIGAEIWCYIDYKRPSLVSVFRDARTLAKESKFIEFIPPAGEDMIDYTCESVVKHRKGAHIATDEEIRAYD